MKVLIISSATNGVLSAFVKEQMQSLQATGVDCALFLVTKKGIRGYLKHYKLMKQSIRIEQPDLIHAHYGLSGLLANLQRRIPVITTFHGSDVNQKKTRKISRIAALLSKRSIYVTQKLKNLAKDKNGIVVPCGVDLSIFTPEQMTKSKEEMNLDSSKNYALFCSSFNNKVKNSQLAIQAIAEINHRTHLEIELLELKKFSREEVSKLLNSCDCLIMTSISEGSPQVIKEALATNRPIVSTDVGAVRDMIEGIEGCMIVDHEIESVIKGLESCFLYSLEYGETKGRNRVQSLNLGLNQVAQKLRSIYDEVLRQQKLTY
ncbi:MAG: glycosyltransferase [Crocinitomicaceae bacterium]|nr:glycosyltransferase [Flavobacteriales bacterium]NQZ35017.1 glycosyltransferase [Crocinitomicaceae bacterium]